MKLLFTIVLLLFSNSLFAQYVLVWSDEFSGSELDNTKWSHETGGNGWGNNESQYYTTNSTNLNVSNGELSIIALQEAIGNNPYTSAKIVTKDKLEFQFGKVEARIKCPMGQGLWPAFWMLGADIDQVSWPMCGEIDVMEHVNNEALTHGTAHWDNGGHTYQGSPVANNNPDEFHVYAVVWDSTKIQWLLDGNIFFGLNIANGVNGTSEFQNDFYLILNLAVGGNWPGYPNSSTVFPAELKVDYVRIYKDQSEVSVEENTLVNFEIWPNPANNFLNIENLKIGDDKTIKILDMQGAVCQTFEMNEISSQIDITQLKPGIYYLSFESKDGILERAKFVKN